MKVIYHCFGGSHSSVTAAAIHLGMLPTDQLPSTDMFMDIPYFDKQNNKDHGCLRFMGKDDGKNDIYILGRRALRYQIANIYYDFGKIFDFNKDIYLVDVVPYVNWYMVLGGITSRKFGLVKLGRPIVLKGTQHAYFKIATLVEQTKMKIGELS